MTEDLVDLAEELTRAAAAEGPRRAELEAAVGRLTLELRAAILGAEELDARIARTTARLVSLKGATRSGYAGFGMEYQNPVRDVELSRVFAAEGDTDREVALLEQELEELTRLRRALP